MEVKGFGGVFWRTNDVEALKNWYKEVLGISMGDWNGAIFTPESENETIFSLFKEDSEYFPKGQSVMLNFQVEDINAYVEHFNNLDIPIVKELERSDYGSFLWIADPDGRWIELWEKNNE
ncbi:Glyoxalase/fosfomycin resistance/dioxygenase domain-containing protein OS=Ureibacillus acetophenoni OX=614649 GN=SAMN05877842_102458 PE=4 SV=1 [Ureibacillus acetophenoni]